MGCIFSSDKNTKRKSPHSADEKEFENPANEVFDSELGDSWAGTSFDNEQIDKRFSKLREKPTVVK